MSTLVQLFCFLCMSLPAVPYPQTSWEVGNIRFTHELLSRGQHLLRLSTQVGFGSLDRTARLAAFADDFARHTCPGDFRFVERPRLMPDIHPVLSHNFVFRCL